MDDAFSISIESVLPGEGDAVLPALIELLQDAVHSGASVGFLPPLSEEEARSYWEAILDDIAKGARVLLVAREAGEIAGSVQLEPAVKPNACHRAEVQKLLVFQRHRRKGIGRRLIEAVEQAARERGRTLLVLDTVQGDTAERLYRKWGYSEVGTIPFYARNRSGTLEPTVVFYKLLD